MNIEMTSSLSRAPAVIHTHPKRLCAVSSAVEKPLQEACQIAQKAERSRAILKTLEFKETADEYKSQFQTYINVYKQSKWYTLENRQTIKLFDTFLEGKKTEVLNQNYSLKSQGKELKQEILEIYEELIGEKNKEQLLKEVEKTLDHIDMETIEKNLKELIRFDVKRNVTSKDRLEKSLKYVAIPLGYAVALAAAAVLSALGIFLVASLVATVGQPMLYLTGAAAILALACGSAGCIGYSALNVFRLFYRSAAILCNNTRIVREQLREDKRKALKKISDDCRLVRETLKKLEKTDQANRIDAVKEESDKASDSHRH